jgi:geranylgeranyl diphosphate synthase type II
MKYIGLAFQMKDDILNVEGNSEKMGKSVGNDEKSGKSTFVKLLGLQKCKELLDELTTSAVNALLDIKNNEFLIWLANELSSRDC